MLWEIIGEAFKYSHDHSADIPADQSLMDYVKERLDKTVPDPKQKDLLRRLAKEWGPFIGGTTDGQSLKFLWLEETLEGENLFCAGTYQKVLELVSKPALKGAKVVFEKKVTKISSKEANGRPEVIVESADGRKETFDEVVVTAPLGWLKRHKEAFEPDLPKRLQEAIDALGYGNLDKVRILPNGYSRYLTAIGVHLLPRSLLGISSAVSHRQSSSICCRQRKSNAKYHRNDSASPPPRAQRHLEWVRAQRPFHIRIIPAVYANDALPRLHPFHRSRIRTIYKSKSLYSRRAQSRRDAISRRPPNPPFLHLGPQHHAHLVPPPHQPLSIRPQSRPHKLLYPLHRPPPQLLRH